MRTAEIRRRYLDFFERRGHTHVPSASLVVDDPNLLFVSAGMVPFVPYYVGQLSPPFPRAVSCQKCVRTTDIEEVGKTSRHGTFFQMNGNFSFGDYFKEDAIRFAWTLLTSPQSEGGLGFDPDRLWASVFQDDDEAATLWHEVTGLPRERIQRRGAEHNFWDMGIAGPCGPDSEIFYDRGPEFGRDGGPEVDEDRFVELWNLVFMQQVRGPSDAHGKFEILGDLPKRNIDTGMGLERVAAQLQGVDSIYEIDEIYPVLERTEALTGKRYGAVHEDDVRLRIIADHVRSALMLIADGVTPSNEARGYVLRRIIRRAVRSVRLLGIEEPVMPALLPVSRDCMKSSYPEVESDFGRISTYAYGEEEAFLSTLRSGTTIFDTAVRQTKAAGRAQLSGDEAFTLHDTYGFPIDITLEMAEEQGLSVDEPEFRRLMTEQRERAKADAQAHKSGQADLSAYRAVLDDSGPTRFTGYAEAARESRVTALLRADGASLAAAGEGDDVSVVLDATPFYAEGGGQQSDTGTIVVDGGELEVIDVQTPLPGVIVHRARVRRGEVRPGAPAYAAIDIDRRKAVSRAHTATHLVHRAMRGALGESAAQAGSLNAPGRLRFDFTTPQAVPPSVLADVEAEVNATLADDLEVRAFLTDQAEARRIGAIALFGEKYGDEVRVVEVGDYARELCGGTHALRSGQLGVVKLLSESSIGAGVRRVEALVGLDAFRYLAREHVLVSQLAETFKAPVDEVPGRVQSLMERLRSAERELARLRAASALAGAAEFAEGARDVFGVAFVGAQAPDGLSGNELRALATDVRNRLDSGRPGVVVIVGATDGKVSFVAATNETARSWRLSAGDIVRAFAPAVGGRGGGREDMAQGGGSDPAGVDEALRLAEHFVGQRVTGSA
jgi:alanyl-tRNA synthetase